MPDGNQGAAFANDAALSGDEYLDINNFGAMIARAKARTVAETGRNFPGQVVAQQLQMSGNIVTTGTNIPANSWLYAVNSASGTSTSTIAAYNRLAITDSVVGKGSSIFGLDVAIAPAAGMAGGRFAIQGRIDQAVASNPGATGAGSKRILGVQGTVSNLAYQGGRLGKPTGSGGYTGNMTAIGGGAIGRKGSYAYGSVLGGEINAFIQAGSSAAWRGALKASTGGVNNARGDYIDAALVIGEFDATDRDDFGWLDCLSIGTPFSFFPGDSDSALIRAYPKQYASVETAVAKFGVDIQWVSLTSGGFAWASTNSSIDDTGITYGKKLYTTGALQAATASMTGITIINAGEYLTKPTFTVQDPASGSGTATFTVATAAATRVIGFGNSGKGYAVNAVVTAIGGTGVAPTWTATVDGAGRITSLALLTNGAWTIPPPDPVQLTSGANSSAWINILSYTNNLPTSATFTPATWEFAATGDGYVPGNVLTIVGDTGTAAQVTVDVVTAEGGLKFTPNQCQFMATSSGTTLTVSAIAFGTLLPNTVFDDGDTTGGFATNSVIKAQLTGPTGGAGTYSLFSAQTVATPTVCTTVGATVPGCHVTTVGSLSVFGGFNTVTGGAGTGASLKLVYGVATFTITNAGSLYPAKPTPKISSVITSYRIADLTAVMTPAAARLSLNGDLGGAVNIPSNVPASAAAAGTAGDIAWDSGFFYAAVATNTWKRVAIATW